MADTFSLRFEIDASRAEAGAKKFQNAINAITASLGKMGGSADQAFSKLMAGGSAGGNFSKLARDIGKVNDIKINPAAVKNLNSLGNAFKNLKAPSPSFVKNITTFATQVPALLNSFNVSGNFADSINKIGTALSSLKVPSPKKLEGLTAFAKGIKEIAPALKVAGNFSGLEKLGAAMSSFRAPSEKAVANMRAFFNALNGSGSKVSINAGMANGIVSLSTALGGLKSPSSTSVKNLKDLFATLATFKSVSGTGSISKITAAFSGFKGPTASQTKNLRDFVTMLSTLKVPTNAGQIATYLNQIAQAASRAGTSLHGFKTGLAGINFRGTASSAQGLTTNLRGLENAFSGTFQAASVFRALIGSITLGTLAKSLYDANTNFLAFKSTLSAVNNNDMKATGEEMRYVEDMANRLGQRVVDLQESYGGFAVSSKLAGVSTDDTRKVFESTVTAMTVLHRSSDRTKLALLALEQMMSKGKVSSEELRRQLGEQLPGAVNLMARALKVTTAELSDMLKKGEVYSSDALPKFAAEIQKTYGPALTQSLGNAVSQFNLLGNAINSLFVVAGQNGIMGELATQIEKIRIAMSSPEFLTFAAKFGERTGKVIGVLGTIFEGLVRNVETVITVFKVLLALNIARFFTAFGSMLLGSIANMGAWGSSLNSLKVLFLGVAPAAAGATTAVGLFGRAAAAASLLSGPIGIVITALGILGGAWYASSQKGTEFATVLDMSKEALDRYKQSMEAVSIAELTVEIEKQKTVIRDLGVAADEARAKYSGLLNNAPTGKRWVEVTELAAELRNVDQVMRQTGMTFDQFVAKMGKRVFDTKQATQLRDAFIAAQSAVAVFGRENEFAQEKVAALNSIMGSTSADGFAGEMAQAGNAASAMADAVASAANRVVEANAAMNLSNAQSAMSKEFIDIYKSRKETIDKVSSDVNVSVQDKIQVSTKANAEYAKSFDLINKSANQLAVIDKKMDQKKEAQKYVEKFGDAATEASRKLVQLNKDKEAVLSLSGITDDQRKNTLAGLQTDYDDWTKSEAKKGKGKKKGGGGGAMKDYDEATKGTVAFQKAQNLLDSQLKKGLITQAQYGMEMDKLKAKFGETAGGINGATAEFEALRKELDPTTESMFQFADKQRILQEALDSGKIKLAEYTDLMMKLRKASADAGGTGSPFIDGINKGLLDLTKTGTDMTNDIAGAVSNAFGGLEDALTDWVTTGKLDFASLTQSILSDVARIVIRYMVIQPIIQALSGFMGGLGGGGGLGATASTGNIPIPTARPFAMGGAFNNGKIVPFAKGGLTNGKNNGIVSSPTLFEMSGKKTGMAGEAGPEGILPLKRNSKGELGVSASGAAQQASSNVLVQPKVNVNIVGGNADNAKVQSKSNADGSLDIDVMLEQIKSAVASDISKGGTTLNRSFEGRYGANPATGNKR